MRPETRKVPGGTRAQDHVPTAKVFAALAGVCLAILLGALWAYGNERWEEDRLGTAPPTGPVDGAPRAVFSGPIGFERPGARQREEAAERLATFGWVDRERGTVRIPIERAIDVALVSSELAPASGAKGGGP